MFIFGADELLAEFEECKLFNDTFTFLMTARYPIDCSGCCYRTCCKPKKEEKGMIPESVQKGVKAIVATGQDFVHSAGTEITILNSTSSSEERSTARRFEKANADFLCLPFWIGWFINLSQLFIYTIVVANVFREEPPPNADIWLRLAQVFAVMVTLYTQSDFIDGVFLLTEGWKAFKEMTTPFKFHYSALLRVISGIFGIFSTFVLVMYSTEVVGLLLNFTAMEFVATLDGSAFEIASKGFLGITLEKKAKEIQEFRYKRKTRRGSSFTRVFAYILCVSIVFAAFIMLVYLQSQRLIGVENEVIIQFDDSFVPELYGISGVYKGCKNFRRNGAAASEITGNRVTGDIGYVDISFDECPEVNDDTGEFPSKIFVYCWRHEGWVYIPKATKYPCDQGNYLLRSFLDGLSVDSNSFDILTHSKANWLVDRSGSVGGQILLDYTFIEAANKFDFSYPRCSAGLQFTDTAGSVINFKPLPTNGTYYPTFEKKDGEPKSYLDAFGLTYRQVFRVDPLEESVDEDTQQQRVIIFNGLRWIAMLVNPMGFAQKIGKDTECPPADTDPDCWSVFVKYFRKDSELLTKNNTIVDLIAISDPMRFLTPDDTGVPSSELSWYEPFVTGNGHILAGKNLVQSQSFGGGISRNYRIECALDTSAACPDDDETLLLVDLTTDQYPSETRVLIFFGQNVEDLSDLSSTIEIDAENNLQEDFTVTKDALTVVKFFEYGMIHRLHSCVPNNNNNNDDDEEENNLCIQIIALDEYGDGMDSPGQYEFSFGSEIILGEGPGWDVRSYQFGPGCSNSTYLGPDAFVYTNITAWVPKDYPF